MSDLLPLAAINTLRSFSDLSVKLYGISCTLYIPNNLTTIEPKDLYIAPDDITYIEYLNSKVWIEWYAKDIVKLRKIGLFTENDAPITARFLNTPEVVVGSYFVVDMRYVPDTYKTDKFEVVDVLMTNTYSSELYRRYKVAPFRLK